jgi:hypothetical protein
MLTMADWGFETREIHVDAEFAGSCPTPLKSE